MITLEIIQRIWQMIEPPSSATEKVEAQQLDVINTPMGHPLVTVDALHQRHLLIPIEQPLKVVEDKQSAGIHVVMSEWGYEGGQQQYVDVICLKPHLASLFDLVVFDILETLPEDAARPDRVCRKVLNHWRELLSRDVKIPERSTLLGVFGELWMLRELVKYDPRTLATWVGPKGARYDFYSGTKALEIKTSTQRKGRTILIHGHDQLDAPVSGDLYLTVLKVEETPVSGEAISELVQSLVELGCKHTDLLLLLANLGLTPDVIAKCDDMRLQVLERRIYRVDDRFPRITSLSFKGDGLPNGILSIAYEIDLSAEPPHPLTPDETAGLFQQFASEVR